MKLYVKRKPFINFRQESVGADEPMDEGLPDADTDPVGRAAEIARRQEAAVARHAAEAKLQDDEDDKAPTKGQKGKKNIKGRARLGNSTGSTSATSPGTSQTASPTRSLSQTSSSSASPTSTTTTSPTISSSPITSRLLLQQQQRQLLCLVHLEHLLPQVVNRLPQGPRRHLR